MCNQNLHHIRKWNVRTSLKSNVISAQNKNSQMIVAREVQCTVARSSPARGKIQWRSPRGSNSPERLLLLNPFYFPRMRAHAPPHPESLQYGVCVLSQKNTAFKNNATEIWLFIEMGHKIRLSGEIGIRETNARPQFCWSFCVADGRWYPASCIWQWKTTTRRVI